YREAKANNLQPEFVAAVVQTESHFKPNAVSQVGAQGLMQLVPKTGRWMGARNLMNPAENVKAGAKYLKYLTERFEGNQEQAIAAYNAGEGTVRKFQGIPPYRETQNYVQRVQESQQDFHEQVTGRIAELRTVSVSR
ncbi:MAG: lytic transglycosylase domain-containing protein, partial [Acidobacteriota bacterium]